MKYLSDYINEKTTELLNSTGGFFAFSDKQFLEQKKEGVKYSSLGMGLLCPSENCERFTKEYGEIIKNGIEQDLTENGREGVIKRELANHEAYYTGDITDTAEALRDYGITKEEILKVYRVERIKNND